MDSTRNDKAPAHANAAAAAKATLRQRYRQRAEALAHDPSQLTTLNQKLNERLCALIGDLNALPEVWGAFQPIPPEPDVRATLAELAGRVRWAFPRVAGHHLDFYEVADFSTMVKNHWGILEPNPQDGEEPLAGDAFSGLIIPGVAFDCEGRRLGRGRGFYDRILAGLKKETLKIGVGFEAQISTEDLPAEAFDIPMDWVVTEARIIKCGAGAHPGA